MTEKKLPESAAEFEKFIDESIDDVNSKTPVKVNKGLNVPEFYLSKKDNNIFRLVPIKAPKDLFMEVRKHQALGGILYNDAFCTTPDRGHCVVCNLAEESAQSQSKDVKDMAYKLKGYSQYMYRALPIDKDLIEKGIGVFIISGKNHKKLLKEFKDKGNLTDLDTGRNINICGEGKGLDRKYDVIIKDPTKVESPKYRQTLENAKPLKDCIFYYTDEQLLFAMDGNALGSDVEEKSDDKDSEVKL
jgi:hypothetical protein